VSRDLSTDALAAVQAEVVRRTTAVSLDFSSGFARYSGAPFNLVIDGQTYYGLGGIGQISVIEEGAELRAYGLVLSLTGIPRDTIALALGEAYQGREAIVYEILLDENEEVIADPIVVFRGRMDQMDVMLGSTATVQVRLENRLADWERARVRRYTDEDQKREYPTDRFFEFVSASAEKEIVWPDRNFIAP
jgi:hypothetical protein